MDQKEIDELLKAGAFKEYNKKQEELIRNISEKRKTEVSPAKKEGKVMGQLSRVTEEAEAGTNMVMEFMENVLNTISKQKDFLKDIRERYKEKPSEINVDEVLTFVSDGLFLVEEHIFNAMDAFQFQDIGRQKLMKVMYTLARLNEYLNELLGSEGDQSQEFGSQIEEKTLEKDKEKVDVDSIVADFHTREESTPGDDKTDDDINSNTDVDKIIAEFQKKT